MSQDTQAAPFKEPYEPYNPTFHTNLGPKPQTLPYTQDPKPSALDSFYIVYTVYTWAFINWNRILGAHDTTRSFTGVIIHIRWLLEHLGPSLQSSWTVASTGQLLPGMWTSTQALPAAFSHPKLVLSTYFLGDTRRNQNSKSCYRDPTFYYNGNPYHRNPTFYYAGT